MYINALTKNTYSGKNSQLLAGAAHLMGTEDQEVAGFKQWLELGRCVQKGQHGTKIFMGCEKKFETPEGEDKKTVFKGRTVFFRCQTAPIDPEKTTKESKPETATPKAAYNPADKLRSLAEGMSRAIDQKLSDRETNTPRKLKIAMGSRNEGLRLQRTQQVLNSLADLWDNGTIPRDLENFTTKSSVYEHMGAKMESCENGYHRYNVDTGKPAKDDEVTLLLWSLLAPKTSEEQVADKLRELNQSVQFSNIPGYFPTPQPVIDTMLDYADIYAGMDCLEPSAGNGKLADAIKTRIGIGNISTVEINQTLADVLETKGYDPMRGDFLTAHFGQPFDRILMNPPFENKQDIDHVRHAYEFLGEMGRLVSVMSAGTFFRSDRKTVEFRQWLDSLGAEIIDLPPGSFKESGTMVDTKLVVIDQGAA